MQAVVRKAVQLHYGKAVNEGGKVLTIGENLVVEQADTVTLILLLLQLLSQRL